MKMDVKAFLRAAYFARKKLEADRRLLEQLKLMLHQRSTSEFSDMPHAPRNCQPDKEADTIAAYIDMEAEVKHDIDYLLLKLRKINAVIVGVTDERLQLLLQYRYQEFLTFEQIAVKLGYGYRQTHRLHSMALAAAREVFEKMS